MEHSLNSGNAVIQASAAAPLVPWGAGNKWGSTAATRRHKLCRVGARNCGRCSKVAEAAR
jgi:hypothetical protein